MDTGPEELMPRLLPVGDCDILEDFDPAVPPRTPQEYLRRVQLEAARCPDVVIAQIDPKKLRKKQTVSIALSGCHPAPEGYSPSFRWQQQQVAQFSAVRQSLNKHRSHWKSQPLDSNVTMVGFPPLLSIVSRMSQATVTSVLEYLVNWFEERDFTSELGRWLYALLACLEKPLLPEAHSLIRQLARRCSEVRAMVEHKEDERVSALNLFICLVGRYFEQRDLADNNDPF
ncbi:hypothetical protein FKM82_019282 [Ascaphus truei]